MDLDNIVYYFLSLLCISYRDACIIVYLKYLEDFDPLWKSDFKII